MGKSILLQTIKTPNGDTNAYEMHCRRIREARQSSNDLRNAVRDINNLKQEMSEIKGLLLKLVK